MSVSKGQRDGEAIKAKFDKEKARKSNSALRNLSSVKGLEEDDLFEDDDSYGGGFEKFSKRK